MGLKNWIRSDFKTSNYVSGILVLVGVVGLIINIIANGAAALGDDITPLLIMLSVAGAALFMISQARK